jgi:2-beta-glucuronyltransferase
LTENVLHHRILQEATDHDMRTADLKQTRRFLVLSAHDYRTPRRASVHFITDELAKRGIARFFSLRYSMLSRYNGDIRDGLDAQANRKEFFNGVECFLWKTWIHPFNTRRNWMRPAENFLFALYSRRVSPVLIEWLKDSDVIIFESGIAPIFFDLACKLNPHAKKIYRASDDLETVNVANYVHRAFERAAPRMNAICLVSSYQAKRVPSGANVYISPHGIDLDIEKLADPSPYGDGEHAVSIGSMLFDPSFFELASHEFPEITFHVIGSGVGPRPGYGPNVKVYGHMKHAETLRYIKHATFGIAPYLSDNIPEYLADSSMKMLQYDFLALPTVCPREVMGSYRSRFGYTAGDRASIIAAINAARVAPHVRTRRCLSWSEVTDRLLDPDAFPDTAVA